MRAARPWTGALRAEIRKEESRSVSRVLSHPAWGMGSHSSGVIVADHLEQPTRRRARTTLHRRPEGRRPAPLFGLAPGGVFPATGLRRRGALLPHLFTLAVAPREARLGGVFSVALSVGLRPPGVTWRPVLWSPDFPPRTHPARDAAQRLPDRLSHRQVSAERGRAASTTHSPPPCRDLSSHGRSRRERPERRTGSGAERCDPSGRWAGSAYCRTQRAGGAGGIRSRSGPRVGGRWVGGELFLLARDRDAAQVGGSVGDGWGSGCAGSEPERASASR